MNEIKLKEFEKRCVDEYLQGHIRSPIHLSGGNEKELIKIFKSVKKDDWVFTTYRSHYHALLKGVDSEWLMNWVLKNKSIHVMNKENKVVTSAIVGGTLSQAVGTALAIKLQKKTNKVWCFCGDMTASLGIFFDCIRYAELNELPITFIVEDNGVSVYTPTDESWNAKNGEHLKHLSDFSNVKYFKYKRIYPHYGCGKFVEFKT